MTNIYSADYSPSGKNIVTGGDDRIARIWDADTGREIIKLEGHLRSIRSVAFSPMACGCSLEVLMGMRASGTQLLGQTYSRYPLALLFEVWIFPPTVSGLSLAVRIRWSMFGTR